MLSADDVIFGAVELVSGEMDDGAGELVKFDANSDGMVEADVDPNEVALSSTPSTTAASAPAVTDSFAIDPNEAIELIIVTIVSFIDDTIGTDVEFAEASEGGIADDIVVSLVELSNGTAEVIDNADDGGSNEFGSEATDDISD